jgi:hypothetical protein
MTKQEIIKIVLLSLIGGFIIEVIANNRDIKSRLKSEGVRTVGIITKKYPGFKGPRSLDYYYFVNNEKFIGYDIYYDSDKHKFLPGDSVIVLYLPYRKEKSSLLKDNKKNILLYINKNQIDSLNKMK